jgi:hypothetical protein
MRIGHLQIDMRSLLIGILVTVAAFLFFNGTPSGAQRSHDLPPTIPPLSNHYQIAADGGGVYILNEVTGAVIYIDKGKCAIIIGVGCRGLPTQ